MGGLPSLYRGPLDCSSHVVPQLATFSKICGNAMVNLLLSAKEGHLSGPALETLRNALSEQMLL